MVNANEVAAMIDHTLLSPTATESDIAEHAAEAARLGVYSICVSPAMLPLRCTLPVGLKVAAVCGFPSGKHASEIKAAEAALAVANGADEIDMVIDIGAALERDFTRVEADVSAVRAAVPALAVLKVIVESAVLGDDVLVEVCRAAVRAGADFVKTSTGFHPAGGATVHAVGLMAEAVSGRAEVKASGGVRTLEDARAMIAAGATRLGVSGTRALLSGADSDSAY